MIDIYIKSVAGDKNIDDILLYNEKELRAMYPIMLNGTCCELSQTEYTLLRAKNYTNNTIDSNNILALNKFSLLLNAFVVSAIRLDIDGAIGLNNRYFEGKLGCTRENIQNVVDAMPKRDLADIIFKGSFIELIALFKRELCETVHSLSKEDREGVSKYIKIVTDEKFIEGKEEASFSVEAESMANKLTIGLNSRGNVTGLLKYLEQEYPNEIFIFRASKLSNIDGIQISKCTTKDMTSDELVEYVTNA